jgi:hypothetical protein
VSKESKSTGSGGIDFTGALFLLFLGLKLCGVINWSWWWVTAPLWGVLAILLLILFVAFVVVCAKEARSRRLGG